MSTSVAKPDGHAEHNRRMKVVTERLGLNKTRAERQAEYVKLCQEEGHVPKARPKKPKVEPVKEEVKAEPVKKEVKKEPVKKSEPIPIKKEQSKIYPIPKAEKKPVAKKIKDFIPK